MKTFKDIFKDIDIDKNLTESVQNDLKKQFKGDKQFDNLKKSAKKNDDDVAEFLDYVWASIGETGIEKLSKKYKMDLDVLAQEMLK